MRNEFAVMLRDIFKIALLGPQPFVEMCFNAKIIYKRTFDLTIETLLQEIVAEGDGGPVRTEMRTQLAHWDFEEHPVWAQDSPRNSQQRRNAIYDLLVVDPHSRVLLDTYLPFLQIDSPIVIAAKRWNPWYHPEARPTGFYWPAFVQYLQNTQHWPPESILSLGETTTAVVQRLADPSQSAPYQAKGLVVGYIQSGKTANITGVVAKAADAGYRLIIILAGTQNMLRNQTQRRLDKELLGAEQLEEEYVDDADWEGFLRHGAKPSILGAFDWLRLTGRTNDYRKLTAGAIEALKFKKPYPNRPFNGASNLSGADAKLLVIKKNATVLQHLAKDLARINAANELGEIPVLIIDDESDQASVNTARPPTDPEERIERTRINGAIVGLLATLPRAQYVGYTATPFANVFINPADAADIFPRDFIISLGRPPGYLGAEDFHDLDGTPANAEEEPYRSNERAYVRPVYDDDRANEQLQTAIDSFVLSGALKRYRERLSPGAFRFRHHTMIVHTSHLTADNNQQLAVVNQLLSNGGYHSGGCMDRLKKLFEADFRPVEMDIGETVKRLYHGGKPALLVNSNAHADRLAFDSEPVWKIIVGGSKLSRGFTIEGLTVSYFRRKTYTADTLMQMGRWCGFRNGYLDLLRLFIARSGPDSDGTFDTYEAFEAICRDEQSFRGELKRYAMPGDGNDPITPRDIPPLVASHLDGIKPTSGNKMYNATIAFRNFGGQVREHRLTPTDHADIASNERIFRELIEKLELKQEELKRGSAKLPARVGIADAQSVLEILSTYRWFGDDPVLALELEFIRGLRGDPRIRDWAIILPQLQKATPTKLTKTWRVGGDEFSVHYRSRIQGGHSTTAYADADAAKVAKGIAGPQDDQDTNDALRGLRSSGRGVLLLYPLAHEMKPPESWIPTMGFTLIFPPNQLKEQIRFVVRSLEHLDEPIIEVGQGTLGGVSRQ
ncbi:MAG: Z1 domain-containing protein [Chloroflexi bacterium]|nr:Z1 domain-containing protein [Chloroflexota bacterium]